MRIAITEQAISIDDFGKLVSNSVGQYVADFEFSDEYADYSKILVFVRDEGTPVEVAVDGQSGTVIIPWEVLTEVGSLKIGAYGLNGDLVRPTVWSKKVSIVEGAAPGETAHEPTILPWEELVQRIGDLEQLETEDKSSLVAAINEVAQGGGGGGTSDHRQLTNRDESDQHPMSAITGLENALAEKADAEDVPNALSELTEDSTHRVVSDTEKAAWNAKQNAIPANTYDAYGSAAAVQANLDAETQTIDGNINAINAKIPSQASQQNLLADRNFVNSSIQSATSNFRGNWNTWTDVPTSPNLYPQDWKGARVPTVNDYMVVGDASDYPLSTLAGTWRFKYGGVWETDGNSGWNPEYQVNETPLTADQLAALNSGATEARITAYDAHVGNNGIHVTAADKTKWNGKQDANVGVAHAGKFLVVGSDGNITPVTMTAWEGGSY